MTDTYSTTPPAGSTGQIPNTDPGVDKPSSTQTTGFCGICFYSTPMPGTPGAWLCRRYAPQATAALKLPTPSLVNWTQVAADDWCGDFRSR